MGAKIYCVCNQKGGVGKTVTSVNLGIGLARLGRKVLLVDMDSQGSLTASLGYQQTGQIEITLADALKGIIEDEPLPCGIGILHHGEGIDLLPADIELSGMEVTLVNVMSRETVLKRYLETVRGDYEIIILDCMPSLGMLTINALAAADEVVIPLCPQYLSIKGLEQLIRTVSNVKRHLNPGLSIAGLLVTMADLRTNYAREIVELVHSTYGGKLRIFKSIIPLSVRAAEISAEGKSIYLHDPAGKVSAAYAALTREVAGGMKSSAKKIRMTSFDDLCGTGALEDTGSEKIREVGLDEIYPFKNHPFKVQDDAAMEDMAESIRKYGVFVPGIVRTRPEGGYELVAGHRRRHASMLAGKKTMPVIIRELDDDEAVLAMVDSNLQRESLLPSEKAWAYKMKLDAVRRKAGRPAKGNSGQVVQNLEKKFSIEVVAESVGENYKQVQRYIRLTELDPELLGMVDGKKLPFNPAVELSYLTGGEQKLLMELMGEMSVIPSLEQARSLKKYSQEGKLDREAMDSVLTRGRPAPIQVTLKSERLKQYFPRTYTAGQIEEVVFSLLEKWKLEQERQGDK